MYDDDVKSVCNQIRRDMKPRPIRRFYLGKHNGQKVFISEAALRNPYYDYSVGFSDIERPFRKRSPIRRGPEPWHPQSLIGEILYWLCCSLFDMMSARKN